MRLCVRAMCRLSVYDFVITLSELHFKLTLNASPFNSKNRTKDLPGKMCEIYKQLRNQLGRKWNNNLNILIQFLQIISTHIYNDDNIKA